MWSHNKLWEKSKEFINRGLEVEDRNSSLFPFWCSLSLELLARSALAKIHSSLLADMTKSDDSILYACGIPSVKSPKSIDTKSVFLRCKRVIERFTENDCKFCMTFMEKRNEELHTGGKPFEEWPYSEWLPEFSRISLILLEFVDKSLEDFWGSEEAETQTKIINALNENKKKEAFDIVKEQKKKFSNQTIDERLKKIKNSKVLRKQDYQSETIGRDIECPACEGAARLLGELIKSSAPKDDNGELVQQHTYLPKKLICYSCNLSLDGYNLLHGIELGATFQKRDVLDPVEYYDIDLQEYFAESQYDEDRDRDR
jgi:hypothetical protein